MKVLITGINGFVGSYLSSIWLGDGHVVWGTKLSNEMCNCNIDSEVKMLNLDVTEFTDVKKIISSIKPDCIYHLAGQSSVKKSWDNPAMTMKVNINGSINICESIKCIEGYKPRIILIGSGDQYGRSSGELALTEDATMIPTSPYAISKLTQELTAMLYVLKHDMDIVFTRSFNHIGPRQTSDFVVADFSSQIAKINLGFQKPKIFVGNIDVVRDFTDVRDVVNAYKLLSEKGVKGEVYNIASGKSISIMELLDKILGLCKVDVEIVRDPQKKRKVDNMFIWSNVCKLKKLGWQPEYTIDESLS